jgi:hypothetical protein
MHLWVEIPSWVRRSVQVPTVSAQSTLRAWSRLSQQTFAEFKDVARAPDGVLGFGVGAIGVCLHCRPQRENKQANDLAHVVEVVHFRGLHRNDEPRGIRTRIS